MGLPLAKSSALQLLFDEHAGHLAQFDAVLIATDHDAFDYALILKHASLIVDTRGVYRDSHPHVVKA